MRITKKFLQLTRFTYPHGTELGLLKNLPRGYQEDGLGNYYLVIGDKPTTMFTCHLDTADKTQKRVNHVFEGNMIKTDGNSILGADDKAGMTVISYMISKGIPGLYYFFIGEEVGCVGSARLARQWKETEFSEHITKCVSFDRRGTNSIITYQMFGRCCSETFAKELANRMNMTRNKMTMSPDSTGILTDSAKFMDLIPECTNISVGYYNEHTMKESQDIEFLKRLCKTVCEIDWETLPIERDPKNYDDGWDNDDSWGFWGGGGIGYGGRSSHSSHKSKKYISSDPNWCVDFFTHVYLNGEEKKVYLHKKQIELEKKMIHDWLSNQIDSFDFVEIIWNGHSLYSESASGKVEYVGSRSDLIEHLPDLKSVPMEAISETIKMVEDDDYGFDFEDMY